MRRKFTASNRGQHGDYWISAIGASIRRLRVLIDWDRWTAATLTALPSNLVGVSSKSERRIARHDVAAYHEEQLTVLVVRVGEALEGFRAGDLDAKDVDRVLFQYARASKELWKFCNLVLRVVNDFTVCVWENGVCLLLPR